MRVHVVTIFAEMFAGPLECSIIKRVRDSGLLDVQVHNLRDFTTDKHHVVDDSPFGGGAGMLMKPEPWFAAVESIRKQAQEPPHAIFLTPQGTVLTQARARELTQEKALLLMCGRYEGVDERVREALVDEEISIGDYVLTGGELPALVLIDAVARLLPGAVGNEHSVAEESFCDGLLEYPQYTRPRSFRGRQAPEVLLSGHHEEIRKWQRRQALLRTRARRPDLFDQLTLTAEDAELLEDD
ncbi:MAG: tRNA (guanosine(37)-N1)-methyltransferase TrmD [Armatimonadota bacterium]|jgi:tRNA (guanine37-N1)-methyltransferase